VVGLALNAESLDEEALETAKSRLTRIFPPIRRAGDEADPVVDQLEDAEEPAGEDDERRSNTGDCVRSASTTDFSG